MDMELLQAIREIIREEVRGIIKEELQPIKEDLGILKAQVKGQTQILKSLENKADINKSEHDIMFNEIALLYGHLKNIDENVDEIKEMLID